MSQKITQEEMLKIYERLKQGESTASVAADYGVRPSCITQRIARMGANVTALRHEQHRAKALEMYERYKQGATYDQIAQAFYYAGGNVVSRILFADFDLPRLGRPDRRKAAYERELRRKGET